MAETKRYYWLKFKEDFFSSKRIKKLRKISADCVIIYLKMQLKALKTNGYLEITGIEDSIADEIALDIDEDSDKVQLTLSYLQACGLMEVSTDMIFLPYVQESTGSETASAQRVREHRANQKALQCNTGVTELKQHCNVEKEIEKEKELELEKEPKARKRAAVYFDNEALNDAFVEFIKMRKSIKKPMTDNAIKRAMGRLDKLAGPDDDLAVKIINQSVDHCWQDFYPLKEIQEQHSTGNEFMDKWANA